MASRELLQFVKTRSVRFSLRAFLLGMTLFCMWLAWKSHVAREQRMALALLTRYGGSARFDWEHTKEGAFIFDRTQVEPQPPGPIWLRRWLGNEYFQQVWEIDLGDEDLRGVDLSPLRGLPHVRYLVISEALITDKQLAFLDAMPRLERVLIRFTPISGEGLAALRSKRITLLIMDETDFSDAGLAALSRLENLDYLNVGDTKITDAGLVHLGRLQKLTCLWLDNTAVSDAGMIHLCSLARLERVYLHDTAVTEAGVRQLAGLKKLQRAYLALGSP